MQINMFQNKVDNIREVVKDLLFHNVYLRDSDDKLVARIWRRECENYGSFDIIGLLNLGKLSQYKTISRQRRLLQKKYPELRGSLYQERRKLQDPVKEDIANFEGNGGII